MIWGIGAAVICILLLLKYMAGKLKWQSLNRLLCKWHKLLGSIVVIIILVHIGVTYNVWAGRNIWLMLSGLAGALLILMIGWSYYFRKRMGSKWLKYHRAGALGLALVIIAHIAVYYVDFCQYKTNISKIQIMDMDAACVQDGTYMGQYNAGYIAAKVKVTVSEGKIESIELLQHITERGKKAEGIITDMVDQQHTKVDTVTGATNSSLVIEKAVEDALKKGM